MFSTRSWHIALLFMPRLIFSQYTLQKDYFQTNFFDNFDFFDGADPTNGFVQYTGQDDSLISSTSTNAVMRVSTEQSTPNGRPSIRITSQEAYKTGLIILDLSHMPGGICGTWPAFWTVGPDWPNGGEIDIIEQVNDAQTNQATLHTGSSCSISPSSMSGSIITDNCDVSTDGNTGCGISTTDDATYGSTFNSNGGGVYATLITSSNIIVWFWPRGSIPSDVLSSDPTPSGWTTPLANFSGQCDFGSAFAAQQLVFDTTFCGDWAGAAWSQGGCAAKASTCDDYVANNGDAFVDAYWSINGLKVYQADSGSQPTTSISSPSATASTPATTPPSKSSPTSSPTPTTTPVTTPPSTPRPTPSGTPTQSPPSTSSPTSSSTPTPTTPSTPSPTSSSTPTTSTAAAPTTSPTQSPVPSTFATTTRTPTSTVPSPTTTLPSPTTTLPSPATASPWPNTAAPPSPTTFVTSMLPASYFQHGSPFAPNGGATTAFGGSPSPFQGGPFGGR